MAKKKVITLCGSGVASSTMCAQKIKAACEENGIDVDVKPMAFRDLQGQMMDVDLIVTITPGLKYKDVPVVDGVPFLTGIGQKTAMEKVLNILKEGK